MEVCLLLSLLFWINELLSKQALRYWSAYCAKKKKKKGKFFLALLRISLCIFVNWLRMIEIIKIYFRYF